MTDTISKCVCKVLSEEDEGTGFLISDYFVLTAYHVVKKYVGQSLSLEFDGKKHEATVLENEEKFKDLDVALLRLDKPIVLPEYPEVAEMEITLGLKWTSRGFPASKSATGENLISDRNIVNQVLPTLHNKKIDIQLDYDRKLNTYCGLSGAPLMIDGKVAGIINTELAEKGQAKELNGLSIKHFKDLLTTCGINVTIRGGNSNLRTDVAGAAQWDGAASPDVRNISDKLKDACNSISEYKISQYSREVVSGQLELSMYQQRDISAIKYRIFEVCQDELIKFIENGNDRPLTVHEIEELVVRFTERASTVIRLRSTDYSYPFRNPDTLRKTVLSLIDECFLAFDKNGIYG